MVIPTIRQIDSAIGTREVGARLASGPWADLGKNRWSVPCLAYMSLVPLGEIVMYLEAGTWRATRGHGGDVQWNAGR